MLGALEAKDTAQVDRLLSLLDAQLADILPRLADLPMDAATWRFGYES